MLNTVQTGDSRFWEVLKTNQKPHVALFSPVLSTLFFLICGKQGRSDPISILRPPFQDMLAIPRLTGLYGISGSDPQLLKSWVS
jgi:hypothetical protein